MISLPTDHGAMHIEVARSMDDLMRVFAVRAAVYIGEYNDRYTTQFDGNDLNATHVLAMISNEPVGTVRVRWFADFAKVERLAIIHQYRSLTLLNAILDYTIGLAETKGFELIHGCPTKKVASIWKRKGASPCGTEIPTHFGNLTPMNLPLRKANEKLFDKNNLGSAKLNELISEPEGAWTL